MHSATSSSNATSVERPPPRVNNGLGGCSGHVEVVGRDPRSASTTAASRHEARVDATGSGKPVESTAAVPAATDRYRNLSQSDTAVSCIGSATTASRSCTNAERSNGLRSRSANASTVRAAS